MEDEKKRKRDQVEVKEDAVVAAGDHIQQDVVNRSRMAGDDATGSMRSIPRKRAFPNGGCRLEGGFHR